MTQDRYARHRAIAGFSQDALAASRVIVVGAGAIGNEVVKNLVLLGVGQIDVVDLDRVELHNLTRSVLLRAEDVGRSKAVCVAERARELDPAVRVEALVGDVRDVLSVRHVRAATAVIGALDNFEARIRVNQLCWLAGTPWVNAAIDSRHATVEHFPFDAATACACYECSLPASVYQRLAERVSCGGLARAARAARIMPTTIVTASLAAARSVQIALQAALAATAMPEPALARRWLLDSQTGHATLARLDPNPACPGCHDLPRRARLVTVNRTVAALLAAIEAEQTRADAAAGAAGLRLADALLWRVSCPHCGPTPASRAVELQPARRVDDRITRCTQCGEAAVRIEIRDVVDPLDLAERYREAGNQAGAAASHQPPALHLSWLLLGNACIELSTEPPPDPAPLAAAPVLASATSLAPDTPLREDAAP